MIIERVDCAADTGNNAVRRCQVKCCAAGIGLALLLAMLVFGPRIGVNELVADAVVTAPPAAGDAHE